MKLRHNSSRSATPATTNALTYRAIEQIQVGQRRDQRHKQIQRCQGRPAADSADLEARLHRSGWTRLGQDGTADPVDVNVLQPPQWVADHHAEPGVFVPVPPDLEELGLVKDASAARFRVTAVAPCPRVSAGPGRVVLATLTHLNCSIFDLSVQDGSGRRDELHPTGIHRFWSEDRNEWVQTDHLQVGERLRGKFGALKSH